MEEGRLREGAQACTMEKGRLTEGAQGRRHNGRKETDTMGEEVGGRQAGLPVAGWQSVAGWLPDWLAG
eukprot:352354-Chlamydomonas_euryale.AAC.3